MSQPPEPGRSSEVQPPESVVDLARQRATARAARDFAGADDLREQIRLLGWEVTDAAEGFRLAPLPPYPVARNLADLASPVAAGGGPANVGLLVEGWPDDVRTCVGSLMRHLPPDINVLGLDLGNVDGAGDVLHELALAHPGRVFDLHVAARPEQAGWAAARTALLQLDPAPVHVVMDVSTVFDGDAVSPLLAAMAANPDVVAAGWRGALVDVDDGWRSVTEGGPGEVDVLLSYLFAVEREAGLASPPHPKARFYRNADLEWSLALRAAGGRLVAVAELPCHQGRHHGYEDTDPDIRDRESRRTYDRLLQRFRGRLDVLAPR